MTLQCKQKILVITIIVLMLSSCAAPTPLAQITPQPTVTSVSERSPNADIANVYFSNPDSPTIDSFRGGPDDALAASIREAHFSIDAAIYHLNLWSIRNALIAAHNAGVTVRVVAESDNMDEVEIQELRDTGITIIEDNRESLMHNKFVVIDGYEVWTGSMNFTINGAYRNNNNLVQIRSTRLAENFTSEFEEMYLQGMFGNQTIENTPYPSFAIEGSLIETFFSPDDRVSSNIVALIQNAQESVFFMAFSFTSDEIAAALLERAEAGVNVKGIFDESQYFFNIGTEFDNLRDNGLGVHLDGNPHNMHHKVIIIDEKIVITGSYNFSRSAEERNDENVLIIHNAEVAKAYLGEFERVLAKAISD
ncbi:MAG: DUF1669 domain-containing protein [Chloroflexi bacterium]|nr:DUF1669 domain-containing protein [Chloroflexota bacterium]